MKTHQDGNKGEAGRAHPHARAPLPGPDGPGPEPDRDKAEQVGQHGYGGREVT